jgi:hypothetical protein
MAVALRPPPGLRRPLYTARDAAKGAKDDAEGARKRKGSAGQHKAQRSRRWPHTASARVEVIIFFAYQPISSERTVKPTGAQATALPRHAAAQDGLSGNEGSVGRTPNWRAISSASAATAALGDGAARARGARRAAAATLEKRIVASWQKSWLSEGF